MGQQMTKEDRARRKKFEAAKKAEDDKQADNARRMEAYIKAHPEEYTAGNSTRPEEEEWNIWKAENIGEYWRLKKAGLPMPYPELENLDPPTKKKPKGKDAAPGSIPEEELWKNVLNPRNNDNTLQLVEAGFFKKILDLEVARAGMLIVDSVDEIKKFRDLAHKIQEAMDQSITTSDQEVLTISEINILIFKNKLIALQSCLQMVYIVTNALKLEMNPDKADVLFLHFSYLVLSAVRVAVFLSGLEKVAEKGADDVPTQDIKSVCDAITGAYLKMGDDQRHTGLFELFDSTMKDPQGREFWEFDFNFDGDSYGMINEFDFNYEDGDVTGLNWKMGSLEMMLDEVIYWRQVEDIYINKDSEEEDCLAHADQDLALVKIIRDALESSSDETQQNSRYKRLLDTATSDMFITKAKKLKMTGAHRNDLGVLSESLLDAQKEMCVLPVDDPIREEVQKDYDNVAALNEVINGFSPVVAMKKDELQKYYFGLEQRMLDNRANNYKNFSCTQVERENTSAAVAALEKKRQVLYENKQTGYGDVQSSEIDEVESNIDAHTSKLRSFQKMLPTGSPLLNSFKKATQAVLKSKNKVRVQLETIIDKGLGGRKIPPISVKNNVGDTSQSREQDVAKAAEVQFVIESSVSSSPQATKDRYTAEMAKVTDPVLKSYMEAYFALLEDISTLNNAYSMVIQKVTDVQKPADTVKPDPMQTGVLGFRVKREAACFKALAEDGLIKSFVQALATVEKIIKNEFNDTFKECVRVYEDSMRVRGNEEGTVALIDSKKANIMEQTAEAELSLKNLQTTNTEKLNAFREQLRLKGVYQADLQSEDMTSNELDVAYERIAGFAPSGNSKNSEDLLSEFTRELEKVELPLKNTIDTLNNTFNKLSSESQQSNFLIKMGAVTSPLSPLEFTKKRIDHIKKYTAMQDEYDDFIGKQRVSRMNTLVEDIYAAMVPKSKEMLDVDIIMKEQCSQNLAAVVLYVNDVTILLKLSSRVSEAISLISSTVEKCMLNMNDAFKKRLNVDDITKSLSTLSVFIQQSVSELTSCVDTKVNDQIKGELLATVSFVNNILANYSQKQAEGVLSNVANQSADILDKLEALQDFKVKYEEEFTQALNIVNNVTNPVKNALLDEELTELPPAYRKLLLLQKKVFQTRVKFGSSATNHDIAFCRTESGEVKDTSDYVIELSAGIQTMRDRIVEDIHKYYKVFENSIAHNLTTVGLYVSEKAKLTHNENNAASAVERVKMITSAGVAGVYFEKITEYMNDPLITSVLYAYMSQKNRVVEKVLRYNYIYINPLSLIPTFRYKGLVNWLMQNHVVPFETMSPEMQNGLVLMALDYLECTRKNLEEQQEALQYRATLLQEDKIYPSVIKFNNTDINTFFIEFLLPQLQLNSTSITLGESAKTEPTLAKIEPMVKKQVLFQPPSAMSQ